MGSHHMNPLSIHLSTPESTAALGHRIAELLHGGDVLALRGDLGSGKTTLVRAIGHQLGAKDISSPSFTLVHEYPLDNDIRLMHVDAWRCDSVEELHDLGWHEWAGHPSAITCVEWADRLEPEIRTLELLEIDFSHAEDGRHCMLQWSDGQRLESLSDAGAIP